MRAARRERRRLAREIGTYRTPAERLELETVLGRYSAEETEEIDEILRRQDVYRRFEERARLRV